ncbi:hypothetical protein HIM_04038 [Hirsutella minnesotensis 3608]|uniref:Zn(2)-C6 fungal-type domain-containing protein n=1 Tax=Hirsutella minnesotensis 3608 TaxID=1043627 RepID=A0A0F8A244_9HYPO|nr:hypothetical protein HIM_04038 [Hirsutella minnesotensis 3608]
MLRRRHKKSRNGCNECKRRHYKCDERHPVCTNCALSERDCSYPRAALATQRLPADLVGAGSAASSPSASEYNSLRSSESVPATPESSGAGGGAAGADLVNVDHMSFLLHFSMDIIHAEINDDLKQLAKRLTLQSALVQPFLLHEVLAISARHLATIDAANAVSYRQQATSLQTRAIQLFNSVEMVFDKSNAVAAILFSSYLGRHALVDTLTSRDHHIDAFLEKYADYAQLHRGLRVVASGVWPLLADTEFKPLMDMNPGYEYLPTRGHEFDGLAKFISADSGLDPESIDQCLDALRFLQIAKDEISDPRPRTLMLFIWGLMCQQPFVQMLLEKQPVALVVLGHYAGLLHYARHEWQIADSGRYIFGLVSDALGPDWAQHLTWPRTVFQARHNVPNLNLITDPGPEVKKLRSASISSMLN